MLLDVKDDRFCPFKWWLNVVKEKPFLEPVMKEMFILLAERLASSFSEQIFSFGGRTSKGDQSRTGIMKLNARQFVHCNIGIMIEKFKNNLLDVANFRQKYIFFVKDWVKEVEESEVLLSSENFDTGKVCPNCLAPD